MKYFSLILFGMLVSLSANEASHGDTDIVARSINFFIFAGIIYYLIADKVKDFFHGRTQGIAHELEKIQAKLKESKLEKEEASKKVEAAKAQADEILKAFEGEKAVINKKIIEQTELELSALQHQHDELKAIEEFKMSRAVVTEIMEEVVSDKNSPLTQETMKEILIRKVA